MDGVRGSRLGGGQKDGGEGKEGERAAGLFEFHGVALGWGENDRQEEVQSLGRNCEEILRGVSRSVRVNAVSKNWTVTKKGTEQATRIVGIGTCYDMHCLNQFLYFSPSS
jgi:hypothetical protein